MGRQRKLDHIDRLLDDWGRWKAKPVIGLGYPSISIMQRIYDDSRTRDRRGMGTNLTARWTPTRSYRRFEPIYEPDPVSRRVDIIIASGPPQYVTVAHGIYLYKMSERKVADEMEISLRKLRNNIQGLRDHVARNLRY